MTKVFLVFTPSLKVMFTISVTCALFNIDWLAYILKVSNFDSFQFNINITI